MPWAKTLTTTWQLMRDPLTEVTRERMGPARSTSRGEYLGSTVHVVHARTVAGDTQA